MIRPPLPHPYGDYCAPPAAPTVLASSTVGCLPRPPFHLLCFGTLSPLLLRAYNHLPPLPSALTLRKLRGRPSWESAAFPPPKKLRVGSSREPPPTPPPEKLRASASSSLSLPDVAPGRCSTECATEHPTLKHPPPKSAVPLPRPSRMRKRPAAPSDVLDTPGMRFRTHALESLYCPVVRHLCFPSVPPSDLWVTQTNGTSSANSAFIAKALDFHFCAPLEHFKVHSLGPYLFTTKVVSSTVGSLLRRISVFALDGVIFHIHGDEQTAMADRQRFNPSLNAAVQIGPPKLDRTSLNQSLVKTAGLGSIKKLGGPISVLSNLNVKAKHACYRCLATDHLIAECRDPITCSSCRRTGHKSFQCKNSQRHAAMSVVSSNSPSGSLRT